MEASRGSAALTTRIGWIGQKPPWMDSGNTGVGVALVGDSAKADVVHAAVEPAALPRLRRELPPDCALVFHLTSGKRLGPRDARRVASADLVVVESAEELHRVSRRFPALAERTRLLPQPIDLDWYAPEAQLQDTPLRGRDLRRFRRFHRLASPVVLYAGPYTHDGGLDLVLDAVVQLRERIPEVRLAAIPDGEIDSNYRDAIERRALGLGHHGIVEWTVPPDDAPFWYACSDIVCAPNRVPLSVLPAAYAAAAGKPFIGSDSEVLHAYLRNGETGYSLAPADLDTVTAALAALVEDKDEARRLGEEARRWAERTLTAPAAFASLADLWHEALSRRLAAPKGSLAGPIRPRDALIPEQVPPGARADR